MLGRLSVVMRSFSTRISLEELESLEKSGQLGYRQPDNQILVDIANTQVNDPSLLVSPNKTWLLQYDSPKFTPISHCK